MKSCKSAILLLGVIACLALLVACNAPAPPSSEAAVVQATSLATDTPAPPAATPLPPTPAPTRTPATPTEAPSPPASSAAALAEKMDAYMSTQTEGNRFSGAVLVARGDEIILSKGYGLADQEQQIPNTPTTRFRIASLTMAFTAMAVLQLQEAGMLDVADPICNYLPDCPTNWADVTIHHLLTHTSGLPDQFSDLRDYTMAKATPTYQNELLAALAAKPILAAPGRTFYYNNANYVLLGYIIEAVTGRSYEDVLQEQIFNPLGMVDSGYSHNMEGLAVGYFNRFREADYIDMSVPFSAGALYSTVEDLNRWTQAVKSGQLVSRETLDLIFSPHALMEPGGDWSYGYGWAIGQMHERPVVGHSGWIEGFRSDINIFPQDDLTTIVWTNREDIGPSIFGQVLAKWALGIE
jgi:CubicO group peptidase (beta-lactamase class C family)